MWGIFTDGVGRASPASAGEPVSAPFPGAFPQAPSLRREARPTTEWGFIKIRKTFSSLCLCASSEAGGESILAIGCCYASQRVTH